MYFLETTNRFNQILVFKSKRKAIKWCKLATRWTDEQILENIHKMHKSGLHYDIFPKE